MTNPLDFFSPDELQAYALALKLEGMAFYLPPSEPFLQNLMDGGLLDEWPLAGDAPLTLRGLQLMREALAGTQPANLLPELRHDYTALFVGLEQVAAPPWESVYCSRDHLLFEKQTLEVRDAYARYGLQIPKLEHEPDDHIGFELLFLSHLVAKAADALAGHEMASAQEYLQAAQEFLRAHPQCWVDQFVERVDGHASSDYYRGLAFLLAANLDCLEEMLSAAFATQEILA